MEVNPRLLKRSFKTNGRLDNRGLTSLVKETTRDTNSQGINSNGIGLVILEYSGFGTKRVNNADGFGESRQNIYSWLLMILHLTDDYMHHQASFSQRTDVLFKWRLWKTIQHKTHRKH